MKTASIFLALILFGCSQPKKMDDQSILTDSFKIITHRFFGKAGEHDIMEYTITNRNGVTVSVMNYGGIITSLKTPDRNGVIKDIVLGYDSLIGYLKDSPYFGAIVGRYGNRIANGKFALDGKQYSLAQNNNGQHLHGGIKGFDKVFWSIAEVDYNKLRLTYTSPDMEEGYPGNLIVEVTYELTDANELIFDYSATTDKKTVINLTQHSYFNLTGETSRDILDHELMLMADAFIPVKKTLIPTGELRAVDQTPFDFRKPAKIGSRIQSEDQQLTNARGYDHCWVLLDTGRMKHAASVYEPVSGRTLDVYTTEPGIQFYSGNFLDGSITGKYGIVYQHRYGFCLETEHYPDSPNQKHFPSTELNPGNVYRTTTKYIFGVR